MSTPGYTLLAPMILPIAWVVLLSLPLVRGEQCSAMTRAEPGDDVASLRAKAIANFRAHCRACTFFTKGADPHIFHFILQPLDAPFRLNFNVKTKQGASIALAQNKTHGTIFAEISIGGAGNTRAVIRACYYQTCEELSAIHGKKGLVSKKESRPFWVEYREGVVSVGKGGREEAFLEWDAGAYHGQVPTRVRVGIASRFTGVNADWVFNQFCE